MDSKNNPKLRRLTVEDAKGGTTIYTKVIDMSFLPRDNILVLCIRFEDEDGIIKTAVQPMEHIFRYIIEPYRSQGRKGESSNDSNGD